MRRRSKRRQGFESSERCPSHAFHLIMSTSRQRGKGKEPISVATTQGAKSDEEKQIDQLSFGLNMMKNYYVQFKEKKSINAEARFDVDSFKDDFPDIYYQFQIRDLYPFTRPLDPYFPGSLMPLIRHGRTS
ncbi:hypothetical protein HAX54_045933 [Datura stramonium]|uniref:Uncharacterized protein n=1 Tax=Datura stramonium TaxID=4076 RepID=A0ABS8WIE8_DATST|nr:hypothetical protein [Datura stramonium]